MKVHNSKWFVRRTFGK